VAFLMMAGSAMAGTTASATGAVNFAREVGAANAIYTMPGKTVTRAMSVIRDATQDFFLDVTLGGGAQFATGDLPAAGDLTLTTAAGGAVTITIVSGGADGNTTVTYFVDITTSFTGLPTFTLDMTGWTIRDVSNTLGGGNALSVTLVTRDSATGTTIDSGVDTVNFATGVYGVAAGSPAVTATTATVDVATARKNFLVTGGDTATADNGATVNIDVNVAGVNNLAGTAYTAAAGDAIELTVAGNLSGVSSVVFAPDSASNVTQVVTTTDVTNGYVVISIPGTNGLLAADGADAIRIVVDGTTQLTSRTLTLAANFNASGTVSSQDHSIFGATNLTVWGLNGTILLAGWVQGNNGSLLSRLYVFNRATNAANITARVFTLPVSSSSGTGTPLATVAVGSVAGSGGRNLRVAEDILTPAGIPLPYTTDGGNLIIELTIEAIGATGVTQTFGSTIAYGTMPMTVLP
jgi:hypothetical protein